MSELPWKLNISLVQRIFVKYVCPVAWGEECGNIVSFFPSFQLLLPISVYVHFPWLFRPLFAASASVCFEIFSRFALPFYFISSLCFSPPDFPQQADDFVCYIVCVAMWWPRKCIFHTFSFVHDIKVLNLTTSQMPVCWFFVS